MNNLSKLSVLETLQVHVDAIEELRERKVLRSRNNPAGDYAEYLGCKCFKWNMAPSSEKDVDAIAMNGTRYQIKSRRVTSYNSSRQLSYLRRLPEGNFDWLLGVIFREDFTIHRVALVPHALVLENSKYVKSVNGWRFVLRDNVWDWKGVKDVTTKMQVTASKIEAS